MRWEKVSDYAIQRGNQTISKCIVKTCALYELWDGDKRIAHYDTSKEAREAADNLMENKND